MAYIISISIFFIYFALLLFLSSEYFLFGFNYIIEFIFLILHFILEKPFNIPYYNFTNEQLIELKNGCYFNLFFFCLFFIIALYFRAFNPEDSDKEMKVKKFIGICIFLLSSILLISSANSYSELQRQLILNSKIENITYEDINDDFIIDKRIIIKNAFDLGFTVNENDKKVLLAKENSEISIFKININNEDEYKQVLKKRYSYNLRDMKTKITKFKNKTSLAVEYFTNKDYNRDYVLRSNEGYFIIHFKSFNNKDMKEINDYKKILISSVYFKED